MIQITLERIYQQPPLKGEVAVPKAQTEGFPPLVTMTDTEQQKKFTFDKYGT